MNKHGGYVLIADDDRDDLALLEEAFRRKQIKEKLVAVQDGLALLTFLLAIDEGAQWPLFILLDLNMPRKNGREALSEIKQHHKLKKIPVIIYSTTDDQREIRQCYELGANSYVVKPVAFEKLLHTVEVICTYWCKIAAPVPY